MPVGKVISAKSGIATALAVGIGFSSSVTQADTISSMNRSALFASQLAVLDGRASEQYNDSVRLQPPRAEPLISTGVSAAFVGRYNGPYLALARDAARRHNVPEDLFLRLIQQESGWNNGAISPKGAIGLAQLMPGTASLLGVDPTDPTQNLDGGARYLRQQYNTFGTWQLALAAYNAGPQAVQQYDGIPPYAETQNYVLVIWGNE